MASVKDGVLQHVKTQGPKCPIGIVLPKMTAKDRKELLDEVLTDPDTYPGTAVAAWMTATYDVRVSPNSVQAHRRGHCSCGQLAALQRGRR
jgi:hypothetical protein